MIKNYFKIALRHLKKNKGYSFINMIGLALGMTCALLILLWVGDELQYDRFHKNYANLYAIRENQSYEGKTYTFSATPGLMARSMKVEIPGIKHAASMDWGDRWLFSLGDKNIYEEGNLTEPDFLKMFSFPLIKGNPSTVLNDLHSLVITERMARKFFGNVEVIGKTLKVNNEQEFTITGIIKNPPKNTSFHFEWLAPFKLFEIKNPWMQNWGNNGVLTYVELEPKVNPAEINKKLYGYIQTKEKEAVARPFLFTINNWRLRGHFEEGKQVGGRIEYVRLFSIIALLIIIIACINFMNLATARSEQRAREVGVRKVMGAGRGILIKQFFGESLVMSLVAMFLATLILFLVLPSFNRLVEKELTINLSNPVYWAGLPLLALFCGIVAGSYPSFYLSSFNPISVFRGMRAGKASAVNYIRKGLVIAQFVISIVLIISTVIIYQQIQHIKSRQLGYNKDNVIFLGLQGKMKDHYSAIQQDLLTTGVVQNSALANSRVLEMSSSTGDIKWQGKDPSKQILVTTESVSPQYISTMGMQLSAGRDFYSEPDRDSSNVIINETLAQLMGKQNPVGQILRDDEKEYQVVGVVRNFVFNDMYGKPDPIILHCRPQNADLMLIRFKNNQDISRALANVEGVMKIHNPGYPFEYKFMDEEFNKIFKSEMLVGKLSRLFAILTILISCLGLFGLAAYTAERRTKEIGIRKVLGASVTGLVNLLCKDFLQLVAIAAIVAFPLAWWVMKNWLQDFAYRIHINWWVFGIAGIVATVIALLTVSIQAIKASVANPVESLRTE